jgi:predicted DNA-binding transcriptional regulator AlpA
LKFPGGEFVVIFVGGRMELLSYGDLQQRGIRLSNSTLLRLEAQGLFPARVRVSARRHGWDASEITSFIATRAAERFA